MSGRTVEAEEALRIGLANRLVEDEPFAAGLAFALRPLAARPAQVLRAQE